MWPKRRLKLLIPPNTGGLAGFQALLEVLGLPYQVEWTGSSRKGFEDGVGENREPRACGGETKAAAGAARADGGYPKAGAGESRCNESEESGTRDDGSGPRDGATWWDDKIHNETEDDSASNPGEKLCAEVFTDLIVWPDVEEGERARRQARALGMREMSPFEFLGELWQTEVLLPVFPLLASAGEKPLLWTILDQAGFAPSLLWQDRDGAWSGEVGTGLGWIVPGAWLQDIADGHSLGRQRAVAQISWVAGLDRLDFYEISERRESLKYIGVLPRWSEATEETEVCRSIAQALGLGVAWWDVRQALSALWPERELGVLWPEKELSTLWLEKEFGAQTAGKIAKVSGAKKHVSRPKPGESEDAPGEKRAISARKPAESASAMGLEKSMKALGQMIEEGQGCQTDDFRWAERPGGAQLSTEKFNDLENRRTG